MAQAAEKQHPVQIMVNSKQQGVVPSRESRSFEQQRCRISNASRSTEMSYLPHLFGS